MNNNFSDTKPSWEHGEIGDKRAGATSSDKAHILGVFYIEWLDDGCKIWSDEFDEGYEEVNHLIGKGPTLAAALRSVHINDAADCNCAPECMEARAQEAASGFENETIRHTATSDDGAERFHFNRIDELLTRTDSLAMVIETANDRVTEAYAAGAAEGQASSSLELERLRRVEVEAKSVVEMAGRWYGNTLEAPVGFQFISTLCLERLAALFNTSKESK